MPEADKPDLTTLTVQLLSAYVSNNAVPSDALADLIRTTKAALAETDKTVEAPLAPPPVPAVSAKASLASRDHIISLIDGKPYKTLKRHLFGHGLTPEEYRARYNLPLDYPVVAPGYSEQRSRVAKELGLGRKKGESVNAPARRAGAAAKSSTAPKRAPSRKAPAA